MWVRINVGEFGWDGVKQAAEWGLGGLQVTMVAAIIRQFTLFLQSSRKLK